MLINASPVNPETRIPHPSRGDVAIILSGGGARAAYQVGVLRGLSRHFPRARPLILAGESAGAINAAYLAAHPGTLPEAVEDLARLWSQLTADEIFRVGALSLARNVLRWGTRLISGGESAPTRDRKSTRLNSSHITISYAVFCLKKKKINDSECAEYT